MKSTPCSLQILLDLSICGLNSGLYLDRHCCIYFLPYHCWHEFVTKCNKRTKTFLPFFLKLAIVGDVVNFINNQKLVTVEAAEVPSIALMSVAKPIADGPNLHQRVSEIEGQNRQHVKEISLLQTTVSEDRKMISQLNGRLSQLEASVNVINTAATNSDENIYGRAKRPARLLPFHFLL